MSRVLHLKREVVADYLRAHAPWMTLEQASAAVGTFVVESRLNPKAEGDRELASHAYGLGQWRSRRWLGVESLAHRHSRSPWDWQLQLDYFLGELATTEHHAGGKLRKAKTLAEAVDAMVDYERPLGWSLGHPRGAASWKQRYDAAYEVLMLLKAKVKSDEGEV